MKKEQIVKDIFGRYIYNFNKCLLVNAFSLAAFEGLEVLIIVVLSFTGPRISNPDDSSNGEVANFSKDKHS